MTGLPSPLWSDRDSSARLTGTWRSALPAYVSPPSPCHQACPVHGEIASWIHQFAQKQTREAWLTLMENNPLPAVIGRICHHPCQEFCNRTQHDETVGICSLERFIGDRALSEGWQIVPPSTQRPEHVAIVGGGPAGLSAAYQLLRRGYRVTLYDAGAALGGLMRHGIPDYRLNKAVLEAEIQRIVDLGLEVHLNRRISGPRQLRALARKFNAVFLATGASSARHLPMLDYAAPYVIDSADFLAAVNAGKPTGAGKRVLVIGGGSAAMDVARSARRLDRGVSVLALESAEQLPAQRTEVTEAFEEGVHILTEAMMTSVAAGDALGRDGVEISCTKVLFTPAHGSVEATITPVEGSEFVLRADTIIPAIGQQVDTGCWGDLLAAEDGLIGVGPELMTSHEGIYAGGDLVSMDRFVSAAIGMGKEAALAVHARFDKAAARGRHEVAEGVPFQAINTAYHARAPRNKRSSLPVVARVDNFDEVQAALSETAALAEAQRCFSCGHCIFCDNCYYYCPDMAIRKLEQGYEVIADYCKGCGLCVQECPTGAVDMFGEGSA